MKSAVVILNYPLKSQIKIGHLDLLKFQFENMLNIFDTVYIISPRDNRKYNLNWNSRVVVLSTGCASKQSYYLSPLADLLCLLRLIKAKNIKVIRAMALSSGFLAVLASKLTKVPAIVSIHTDRKLVAEKEGESRFKHFLLGLVERWTYRNVALVPVISKYIWNYVRKTSRTEKLFLHYNFVDTALFRPIKHKNKVPVLIFVGRLVKVHGTDLLIDIVYEVLKKKKILLKICGEGPERKTMEQRVKALKLSRYVKFLGRADHTTILPKELATADLFISPALSGMTLIEAMACGLPVVAADIEWSKEILCKGVGKLVKYENVNKFAGAVLELLSNNKLYRERARALALERFAINSWKARERRLFTCHLKYKY